MFSWAAFFALVGFISGIIGIYGPIKTGYSGSAQRFALLCIGVAIALIIGSIIFKPILVASPTSTTDAASNPTTSNPGTQNEATPGTQSTPDTPSTPTSTPTPTSDLVPISSPLLPTPTPTPIPTNQLPNLRRVYNSASFDSGQEWQTLNIKQQRSDGSIDASVVEYFNNFPPDNYANPCTGTITHFDPKAPTIGRTDIVEHTREDELHQASLTAIADIKLVCDDNRSYVGYMEKDSTLQLRYAWGSSYNFMILFDPSCKVACA